MTAISAVFSQTLLRIAAVKNHSQISALYIEDNIEPVSTNIIPGLRFDYLSDSGGNFSPSLNLSQELGDYFKVKAGLNL